MKEWFKIQRPLITTESTAMCLVYNEDRSTEFFAFEETMNDLPDEKKFYVLGEVVQIEDETTFICDDEFKGADEFDW